MSANESLTLIGLGLSASWIITGFFRFRRAQRMRHKRCAEQIRSQAGEARTQLVWLALRGKVSAESSSFRSLYFLQTLLLRRDDQYGELWHAFYAGVTQIPSQETDFASESSAWPKEMHVIARLTAEAIRLLLIEYSVGLRWGAWFLSRILAVVRWLSIPEAQVRQHLRPIERKLEEAEERRNPERRYVRDLHEKLAGSDGLSLVA